MTFTPMFAATVIVAALIFAFSLQLHRRDTTTGINCRMIEAGERFCDH